MRVPRLPSRAADAWECSFVFDSPRAVFSVSSRGGLVVASGEELHVVRPGAESLSSRPTPAELGTLLVAAAEPQAPWRFAVASRAGVVVFVKGEHGDQILRLRSESGIVATHLAWGRAEGQSTLYIRWNDGEIVRMKADISGVDTTDLPAMDAIAADAEGALAMISFAGPEPRAFVTRDGETLAWRSLPKDVAPGPTDRVELAVADMGIAFTIVPVKAVTSGAPVTNERRPVFVSRADDAPFIEAELLAGARALAFEGTRGDAALFGALEDGSASSIVRVEESGEGLRVAEFASEGGHSPSVAAISWDASRGALWIASPVMGLATCVAPGAKGADHGIN